MFFVDMIFSIEMSHLETIFLTKWNFRSICFPLQWFMGSLALATAPLLSKQSLITLCIFGTTSNSFRNQQSHTASLAASQAATYSISMVESVIQDCLTLLHRMAPLLKVNTTPKVDIHESLSEWKLESIYQMGIKSPLEYTGIQFLVLLRYLSMFLTAT